MIWTPQQDAALKGVAAWLRNPAGKTIFRLFGYAGSGKSTVANEIAQQVVGIVRFAAFTGKAAHVMRQKGCDGASTVHSLLYLPKNKCRQRLEMLEDKLAAHDYGHATLTDTELMTLESEIAREREALSQPAFSINHDSPLRGSALLILDECSMIGTQVANDLLSFGVPILALGDPAQLPPVYGGGFFTDAEPDIMLTDIQRQAKESPIIALADTVRRGGTLEVGDYGDSRVLRMPKDEAGKDAFRAEIMAADQVLVGRNATRHFYNRRMRELDGRTGLVEAGDKVVCKRNNHDKGLLNGGIWRVMGVGPGDEALGMPTVALSLRDDEEETALDCYAHTFGFGENDKPSIPYWERQVAEEFAHARALTVHSAQGSQWNHVVVVDESGAFRDSASRWLYTAVTRAAERVTVVLP